MGDWLGSFELFFMGEVNFPHVSLPLVEFFENLLPEFVASLCGFRLLFHALGELWCSKRLLISLFSSLLVVFEAFAVAIK